MDTSYQEVYTIEQARRLIIEETCLDTGNPYDIPHAM